MSSNRHSILQVCSLLLCFYIPFSVCALQNQMQQRSSPYLSMHGQDPVAWQLWGKAAMVKAKKQNKLLFVSIGYFSCHWCHVMQRESFSDKEIALLLNENFIPIKVDRELDPALDAYLIDFVQRTRGHAGWPLNVFLTPDGNPVVGLVYAPKQQFRQILHNLTQLWRKDSLSIKETAAAAAAQIQGATIEPKPLKKNIGKKLRMEFLRESMQHADELSGGFGEQNKFPMLGQLNLLLRFYLAEPDPWIESFLSLTLDQMASQGLRDHLGGGFFRYTVDPVWQTPHFEKMLYDNAQLAILYLKAGHAFGRDDYIAVGRETLNFLQSEFLTRQGAMVSSFSAVDDKGVEGGYYLWSKKSLGAILSDRELEALSLLWGLESAPPFEAGYLPFYKQDPDEVAKQLGMDTVAFMQLLETAQLKLYKYRKKRTVPVDYKVLAAWNGMALSAFVQGARLPQPDGLQFEKTALSIRNFIVNKLWDGQRLIRSRAADEELGRVGLEDYVFAASGLLEWGLYKNQKSDISLAKRWVEIAWQRYFTATGWKLSDDGLLPHLSGQVLLKDNPLPSASAILQGLSLRISALTQDAELHSKSIAIMGIGQESVLAQPFWYPGQIGLIVEYQHQYQQ